MLDTAKTAKSVAPGRKCGLIACGPFTALVRVHAIDRCGDRSTHRKDHWMRNRGTPRTGAGTLGVRLQRVFRHRVGKCTTPLRGRTTRLAEVQGHAYQQSSSDRSSCRRRSDRELKSVERIHPVHLAQGVTYLKLTDCPAGLIMNFNVTTLRTGIRRLSHPDRYRGHRMTAKPG